MRKNPVIRWQLLVLGGITLLLLYRVVGGPPPREGLVVLERMDAKTLHHRSFEVERTIKVSVEGNGSFQSLEASDGAMAAYGWVINAETREPIWTMSPQNTTRIKGTLAEVKDVLKLEAGTYHLMFASYGDELRGRLDRSSRADADWEEDEGEWHIVMNLVEGKETDIRTVHLDKDDEVSYEGERLVWRSEPVGNNTTRSFLFRLAEKTSFRIRATGEHSEDVNDFGYIEDQITGRRVWEMDFSNSLPAGGVAENRRVQQEVFLDAGIYKVAYQTDATHAYESWKGNPPFDPMSWGLVMTTRDTSDPIAAFDPWEIGEPAISMTPFRDHQLKATSFKITEKKKVALFGMGEMKRNDRYDYGWIERSHAGSLNLSNNDDRHPDADYSVWEMTYEESMPAGGDDSNRRVLAFVDLMPDDYTLYYRTDGSHSFEDWSNGEPAEGEKWGISLFPLNEAERTKIQVLAQIDLSNMDDNNDDDYEEGDDEHDGFDIEVNVGDITVAPEFPVAVQPPSTLSFNPSDIVLSMNKLGSEVTVQKPLELQGWSRLNIVAVGEITMSGNRYDYGYIVKAENGEVVWEMNLENTQPAGGDEANRIFDGTIDLAAGSYIVHFKTDGTHAFGDFNTPAPMIPEAWGITIARAE
ncbi:MAG: hypothetical protein AB8G77_02765 [Rhodothermales bacterium]